MDTKNKKDTSTESITIACFALFLLIMFTTFTGAAPTGPNSIVISENTTGASASSMMVNISGGYIAKMNMTVTSQNKKWKAFVGEIDGKFTLDDATGSTIYDWDSAITQGEVYATRTSGAVNWGSSSIRCATPAEIIAEDVVMGHSEVANISSTFNATYGDGGESPFYVADVLIQASSNCSSTDTYVNNASVGAFDEVILYDSNNNIIFATILDDQNRGYDGGAYDFQMIVPENATVGASQTPYYIYVELG